MISFPQFSGWSLFVHALICQNANVPTMYWVVFGASGHLFGEFIRQSMQFDEMSCTKKV
jgi:hypothetical protein